MHASAVLATVLAASGAALGPAAAFADDVRGQSESIQSGAAQSGAVDGRPSGNEPQSGGDTPAADTSQSAAESPASVPSTRNYPIDPKVTVNDDVVFASGDAAMTWTLEGKTPASTAGNKVHEFLLFLRFNAHMFTLPGQSSYQSVIPWVQKADGKWYRAVEGDPTKPKPTDEVYYTGTWYDPGPDSWFWRHPNAEWAEIGIRIAPGTKANPNPVTNTIRAVRLEVKMRMNTTLWKLGDSNNSDGKRPDEFTPIPADLSNTFFGNLHAYSFHVTSTGGDNWTNLDTQITSKWATITARKTDAAGQAVAGAEYSVFTSRADAQAMVNAKTQPEAAAARAKAVQFPTCGLPDNSDCRSFPTKNDGFARIPHLRQSAFWKGTTHTNTADPNYRTYYIAEAKAAPGHERSPEIKTVTLTRDTTVEFQDSGANGGFVIPLAGGSGTRGTIAIGLAGAAGALVLLRRLWLLDRQA